MSYTDSTPIPFGKYKGTPLEKVPAKYLLWLDTQLRRDDWRDLQAYIRENYEALKLQAKNEKE